MMTRKTFLYFAYGSNLLTERIHINNPSAVFRSIARLDDHQLDFNYFSKVNNYILLFSSTAPQSPKFPQNPLFLNNFERIWSPDGPLCRDGRELPPLCWRARAAMCGASSGSWTPHTPRHWTSRRASPPSTTRRRSM